jgi:hypothetical protein
MAQQPLVGQGLLIIEAARSHSDTPHFVGLLWTSDQSVAETSTWQCTTLTTDRHPCPRRDSNPQSQQANADPRLKLHGHWNRQPSLHTNKLYIGPRNRSSLKNHIFVTALKSLSWRVRIAVLLYIKHDINAVMTIYGSILLITSSTTQQHSTEELRFNSWEWGYGWARG